MLRESTFAEVALSEVSLKMGAWLQERMQERESILRSKAAERGEERVKKSKSVTQRKQGAEEKVEKPLGLTEIEVRAVARGDVKIRWKEQRPGLVSRRAMRRRKKKADLEGWVREHFPPEKVLADGKEARAVSAQMLLILWETEKGSFPSQARTFTAALSGFTRELKRVMKRMGPPYSEAKTANVNRLLAPGVGSVWFHTRFPFVIEKLEGRFVEKWKDYLRWLASGHIGRSHGARGSGDQERATGKGKEKAKEGKSAKQKKEARKRKRNDSDVERKESREDDGKREAKKKTRGEEKPRRKQAKRRSRGSWSGDEGSEEAPRTKRRVDGERQGRGGRGRSVVAGHGRATEGSAVP